MDPWRCKPYQCLCVVLACECYLIIINTTDAKIDQSNNNIYFESNNQTSTNSNHNSMKEKTKRKGCKGLKKEL